MRLGVITDEIDDDLERALIVAQELGIREVDLDSLWGRNIVDLPEAELRRAEELLESGGIQVVAIGTMAFKSVLLEGDGSAFPAEYDAHLDDVRKGCELANWFGAPFVRVFSFRKNGMIGLGNPTPRLPRGGEVPDNFLEEIVIGLRKAADLATDAGVTLVLENVRSCWGNSCWNTARILEAADHPRLKMVWDPGNDYVSGGDPYPEGYEVSRPWMAHVHIKNASVADPETGLTRWERVGNGDLDLQPMLRRLSSDGYEGAVMLETHWRGDGLSSEESTRQSFADLVALLH